MELAVYFLSVRMWLKNETLAYEMLYRNYLLNAICVVLTRFCKEVQINPLVLYFLIVRMSLRLSLALEGKKRLFLRVRSFEFKIKFPDKKKYEMLSTFDWGSVDYFGVIFRVHIFLIFSRMESIFLWWLVFRSSSYLFL